MVKKERQDGSKKPQSKSGMSMVVTFPSHQKSSKHSKALERSCHWPLSSLFGMNAMASA
jgi:hypothetical protein